MREHVQRFRDHVHELYPRFAWLPPVGFVGWPLYCFSIGERRWELLVLMLGGGVLPYVGPRSKRFFLGLLPLGLVALFYDAMRFFEHAGISPPRIHVCDLRAVEMRLFGVEHGGALATPHDAIQAAPNLALDLFFAVPYGTFLAATVLFGAYLYVRDYAAMKRFGWGFFAVNVAGFAVHHLVPAAPPWYFHAHGCTVDLTVRASEGANLARVDAYLGVPFFRGLYARSHEVFGALPSLHVAYPALMVIESWACKVKGSPWPLRAATVAFAIWTCAAAVYLDHHWIVDVVAGVAFAAAASAVVRFVLARGRRDDSTTEAVTA